MSTSGGSSGGSTAGALIVRKFPIAFNTPGILAGHTIYTPTVGDVLLDAWIEVTTAWNGTTPLGDIGTFDNGATGIFGSTSANSQDMTDTDFTLNVMSCLLAGDHMSAVNQIDALGLMPHNIVTDEANVPAIIIATGQGGHASRFVPAKFANAHPIKVCVSQDGTNTGANPGATQGAGIVYLVTSTPT